MKQLTQLKEFIEFRNYYKDLSGINVSIDYLQKAKVYGFYSKGILSAGFCINTKRPLRTIQAFSSKSNQEILNEKLCSLDLKEITCFWISKQINSTITRYYVWFQMGLKASSKSLSDFVIYGTKHKGLAKIYDLSNNAYLLHHDKIGLIDNYIFIAKSKHVISGLLEQIAKRKIDKRDIEFPRIKLKTQKMIEYEIYK